MTEKQILDTDDLKAKPVDSSKHTEIEDHTTDNPNTDNQFFGPWYSYKTTHTISIAGTKKIDVPTMIERIQLVKCWEIAPIPKKIRK
jgi:hypothetical protein